MGYWSTRSSTPTSSRRKSRGTTSIRPPKPAVTRSTELCWRRSSTTDSRRAGSAALQGADAAGHGQQPLAVEGLQADLGLAEVVGLALAELHTDVVVQRLEERDALPCLHQPSSLAARAPRRNRCASGPGGRRRGPRHGHRPEEPIRRAMREPQSRWGTPSGPGAADPQVSGCCSVQPSRARSGRSSRTTSQPTPKKPVSAQRRELPWRDGRL